MGNLSIYRSVFISDTHLGTKDCQADALNDFLQTIECETLYLIGDILDFWRIAQNKWVWYPSHSKVVQTVFSLRQRGIRVKYTPGNHDELLRSLAKYGVNIGEIEVAEQFEHIGADGNRYLVIHGDLFDGIGSVAPWLAHLGDKAYDIILRINAHFNEARRRMGFGYWSLSKFLKHKVKGAVDFIFKFENNLAEHCKKKGFDGVICGHIHHAEIKMIDGIVYMNDGDWVESLTALVEHYDGTWEIINWKK